MTGPTSEIRVVAEAVASPDGWWAGVRGCARAASDAGADALRVTYPHGLPRASAEDWIALRRDVLRAGLDLFVTVSDAGTLAELTPVGVGGWAAPAEAAAEPQLGGALGAGHLPVLLLVDRADAPLAQALANLQRFDVEITVLFGSAERPTPAEASGLDRLRGAPSGPRLARGFADRSGTGWTALAACALGADLAELPLVLSPYLAEGEGALDPDRFRLTVEGLRYLAWARTHAGP